MERSVAPGNHLLHLIPNGNEATLVVMLTGHAAVGWQQVFGSKHLLNVAVVLIIFERPEPRILTFLAQRGIASVLPRSFYSIQGILEVTCRVIPEPFIAKPKLEYVSF